MSCDTQTTKGASRHVTSEVWDSPKDRSGKEETYSEKKHHSAWWGHNVAVKLGEDGLALQVRRQDNGVLA